MWINKIKNIINTKDLRAFMVDYSLLFTDTFGIKMDGYVKR